MTESTSAMLRLLPVPATEPRPALRLTRPREPAALPGQAALALEWSQPPPAAAPAGLPDPRRWVARFVQAAVEVAAGYRPPGQVLRWVDEEVHETLSRRHRLATHSSRGPRPTARVRVRTIRVSSPRDAVVEASAVVADRGRIRAVAVRLEGRQGRWRVTALELGR
jgi:hypothetical protein